MHTYNSYATTSLVLYYFFRFKEPQAQKYICEKHEGMRAARGEHAATPRTSHITHRKSQEWVHGSNNIGHKKGKTPRAHARL